MINWAKKIIPRVLEKKKLPEAGGFAPPPPPMTTGRPLIQLPTPKKFATN